MKKKVRFWMYAAAGVILAVVGIWGFWPEYGSGYSEDQRREWNEVGKERLNWSKGSSRDREKSRCDAIEWRIDFTEKSEQLPLEGMSNLVLKQMVDQGNGDACLELAFRFLRHFPTASDADRAEKYLKRAVVLGRPGADFLLRLLDYSRKDENSTQCQNIEGYRNFLLRLSEGDFSLGKVFVSLAPNDAEGLNRLDAGLMQKGESGDIVSLRNRGHLMFLKISCEPFSIGWWFNRMYSNYSEYYQKPDRIVRQLKEVTDWLPEFIKPDVLMFRGMIEDICNWMMSREKEKIRKSLEKPLGILAKAAEQGDLHAKYLWSQAVILCRNTLTKEDWENHLRYADDLVKAGGIYRGDDPFRVFPGDFRLESSFYEARSFKKMIEVLDQLQKKECAELFPEMAGKPELLKMDVACSNDLREFMNDYVKDVLKEKKLGDEERGYGFRLIEQAAKEGDMVAMFELGRLLSAGCVVEQDEQRAWELFQKVKGWCEMNHNQLGHGRRIFMTVFSGNGKEDYILMDCVLAYEMMGIVSRYGDMPGMTVDQAFDQFVKGINDMRRVSSTEKMPDHIMLQLKEQFEKLGYKVPDKK